MITIRFFDLHTDTLYKSLQENKNLFDNDLHVSGKKLSLYSPCIVCLAVWIPDNVRGQEAVYLLEAAFNRLNQQVNEYNSNFKICTSSHDIKNLNGKVGIIFTVEGGAVLNGKIENLELLQNFGVKMMTLTWNGVCELGDGSGVEFAKGLTLFGKKAVCEMQQKNIIVDLSHASEKLFYDVCEIATKPFVLSHSNSKKICNHVRNITDDQFLCVKRASGLVGVTFCKDFLSASSQQNGFESVLRHIEHFLELGGEDNLSIGSDFDGADLPSEIKGTESISDLFEFLLKKNHNETLLNKIFFDNAYNFILKFLEV